MALLDFEVYFSDISGGAQVIRLSRATCCQISGDHQPVLAS